VEGMGEPWKVDVTDPFSRFLGKIITFLPNLLVMITIFIVGFFIAWVVKKLLSHFLRAIRFDKLSEQWGLTHVLSKGDVSYSPSHLLSQLFYWVIVLITLILGINALEVAATQALITKFFNYLPHLFAAIFILVVGYLIASFLGQATLIAAVNLRLDSARLFSRTVRWFIVILALTMALYQLGIAEKVVMIAFTVILGGTVLALAIAFGWGGRDLAKGLLEKLYKRKAGEEGGPDQDHISHV
jgi:hypothetical protein